MVVGDWPEVEAVVVDAALVWLDEPQAATEMASTANQLLETAHRRRPRPMSVTGTSRIVGAAQGRT
jgi:hypothetical protein